MLLNRADIDGLLDTAKVFGRPAPLEIEIGVGKGMFLRQYAAAHPELNLLGLEKSRKWLLHAMTRIEKTGVPNVRLLETYVEPFLRGHIGDETVRAYHVYFPDPWPKKRHARRRLFQPGMVSEFLRTLEPGGALFVASDCGDYFDVIAGTLAVYGRENFTVEEDVRAEFVSNFQAKYEREGRPLHFLRATKGVPESPAWGTS